MKTSWLLLITMAISAIALPRGALAAPNQDGAVLSALLQHIACQSQTSQSEPTLTVIWERAKPYDDESKPEGVDPGAVQSLKRRNRVEHALPPIKTCRNVAYLSGTRFKQILSTGG